VKKGRDQSQFEEALCQLGFCLSILPLLQQFRHAESHLEGVLEVVVGGVNGLIPGDAPLKTVAGPTENVRREQRVAFGKHLKRSGLNDSLD